VLSFVTDFPIRLTNDSLAFLCAIRKWLLGSPHTGLLAGDLEEMTNRDEWSFQKQRERLESLRCVSADRDDAAVRYVKNEQGLEWVSTIVFSRRQSVNSWVSIAVSCESQRPATIIPIARKPVVVHTLLRSLGGAADGDLDVGAAPVRLENVDIDIAARCISGEAGCRLPIVYVSASFQGDHIVDVDHLADKLAGMAHVVVEPNRPFSLRLRSDVNSRNVYGGTVGIYWPDGGGRRSYFLSPENPSASAIESAIFEEVRTALTNRRPLARCTWAAVQEAVSRRAYNTLKERGSTDLESYISEFDKELHAKGEQLADAEKEIARLRAEVRKYEAGGPADSRIALALGGEQEFYDGELTEIVRDALESAWQHATNDSRRQHLLGAVVAAIPSSDEARSKRERLKAILRDFRTMGAKTRRSLLEFGFIIEDEGKHYKLIYQGDDRYTFTLPKSGSDYRGGLNAAGDISRLLF
jgi:hypothetical protein